MQALDNCIQEIVPEPVATEETNSSNLNFNDIVREAIRQSDISFADNERKEDFEENEGDLNWNTKETPSSQVKTDREYSTAVVQIASGNPAQKVQVVPMPTIGGKRPASSFDPLREMPLKSKKKNQDSPAGNGDNLATILSGQNTTAAIPQSLALLQSRYLVSNKPGLSVIGSDSQQATVLLLANQNLMSRQPKNDTISLMLA